MQMFFFRFCAEHYWKNVLSLRKFKAYENFPRVYLKHKEVRRGWSTSWDWIGFKSSCMQAQGTEQGSSVRNRCVLNWLLSHLFKQSLKIIIFIDGHWPFCQHILTYIIFSFQFSLFTSLPNYILIFTFSDAFCGSMAQNIHI